MENNARLCKAGEAALVIIDIQERLAAAMPAETRAAVLRNVGILLQAGGLLNVPRFLTEQYPAGLGPTESAVLAHLGAAARRFEKTCFSSCGADGFLEALRETGRRQVVLAGMEAHVCVLQTAVGLLAGGWEVYVAEDAICSRNPLHQRNACRRLERAGAVVTNSESVVFEWLVDARHEHFKAITALVR